jgi:hypothetical protein
MGLGLIPHLHAKILNLNGPSERIFPPNGRKSLPRVGNTSLLICSSRCFCSIERTVDLKQKLTAAGVTDIFNMDKANFSAIADTKLAVENVIHIAKIKVDCLSVFVADYFPLGEHQ